MTDSVFDEMKEVQSKCKESKRKRKGKRDRCKKIINTWQANNKSNVNDIYIYICSINKL